MSTKRKLLVALAVFLLVIGGFVFYIWRGTKYWPALMASGKSLKRGHSPKKSLRIVMTTYTGKLGSLLASNNKRMKALASLSRSTS